MSSIKISQLCCYILQLLAGDSCRGHWISDMVHLEIMLCLVVKGLLGFRFDLFGRPRGVQPLNVGVGLVLVGVLQEEIVLGEVVLKVKARYSCIFKHLFSLWIQKMTGWTKRKHCRRWATKVVLKEVVFEVEAFSIKTILQLRHKNYNIKWVIIS